jgi:hypothetical protein
MKINTLIKKLKNIYKNNPDSKVFMPNFMPIKKVKFKKVEKQDMVFVSDEL